MGDDLCNQVLEAANICRDVVKNRIYVLHSDMKKSLISKLRFRGYDKKISHEATQIITVSEYTKNRNFLDNKGQKQFIECADTLFHQDKDYRFAIIGNIYDEQYYKECIELINGKFLQDVFIIYQGIHNASDYIDMFDVQAVPSMYDESFGLISVEAMASGVPVVAFACGGIPEVVVDGRNGFVVPVGDSQMMAERIDYLINNTEERNIMSEKCEEDYLSKFSTSSMVNHYLELLKIN